jgi:DNA polymerase III subunit epsilon
MIKLDRPLVVTDTETTGISALENRIIEIGAIRLGADLPETSFERLINPGISIPYRITRLTGITTAMIFSRPTAAEVLPEYFEFLGTDILVAHNLSFDLGFLNAERARLGLGPLPNEGLCTLRLARRLLPGLRSKSLENLAKFFRIPGHGRHRALRDVEVTVGVLKRLIAIAHDEHRVETIEALLALQTRTYAGINPLSKHVSNIRRTVLPRVPDDSGVYRMLDGKGRVLYVGKAKVLSNRVRSYFNAIEAHSPRIRQLIGKVRDIEWTITDTELQALLLESEQISSLDPAFNRAQRKSIARPFLRIGTGDVYPRITTHVYPRDDVCEYYGPFRSRSDVRCVIDIIESHFRIRTCDDREFSQGKTCLRADLGQCLAPCVKDSVREEYSSEIEKVRSFLGGETERVLTQIRENMQSASERLAFEEAARLRDMHDLIDGFVLSTSHVADRIFHHDIVLWHSDPTTERREIMFVRHGMLVAIVLARDLMGFDDPLASLLAQLQTVYSCTRTEGFDEDRGKVNHIRVLGQWMFANRDRIIRFDREEGETVLRFADRIGREIIVLARSPEEIPES